LIRVDVVADRLLEAARRLCASIATKQKRRVNE
jgi:hypothetical protein